MKYLEKSLRGYAELSIAETCKILWNVEKKLILLLKDPSNCGKNTLRHLKAKRALLRNSLLIKLMDWRENPENHAMDHATASKVKMTEVEDELELLSE